MSWEPAIVADSFGQAFPGGMYGVASIPQVRADDLIFTTAPFGAQAWLDTAGLIDAGILIANNEDTVYKATSSSTGPEQMTFTPAPLLAAGAIIRGSSQAWSRTVVWNRETDILTKYGGFYPPYAVVDYPTGFGGLPMTAVMSVSYNTADPGRSSEFTCSTAADVIVTADSDETWGGSGTYMNVAMVKQYPFMPGVGSYDAPGAIAGGAVMIVFAGQLGVLPTDPTNPTPVGSGQFPIN